MIILDGFLGIVSTKICSKWGLRTVLIFMATLFVFSGVIGLALIDIDNTYLVILSILLIGLGRGTLSSIGANCIGMITSKKNLAFQMGFYLFASLLGQFIFLTVFTTISSEKANGGYGLAIGALSGIVVISIVFSLVLFVCDLKKGKILFVNEKTRN